MARLRSVRDEWQWLTFSTLVSSLFPLIERIEKYRSKTIIYNQTERHQPIKSKLHTQKPSTILDTNLGCSGVKVKSSLQDEFRPIDPEIISSSSHESYIFNIFTSDSQHTHTHKQTYTDIHSYTSKRQTFKHHISRAIDYIALVPDCLGDVQEMIEGVAH